MLEKLSRRLVIAALGMFASIEYILRTNHIDIYFEQIISDEKFVHSKTNPEIYQHSIAELGLASEKSLVKKGTEVGSEVTVQADLGEVALKSECFVIDKSQVTYWIDSTKEILGLI